MMTNVFYYQTPIGKIAIVECEGKITNLCFDASSLSQLGYNICETDVLKEANRQLQEYFLGRLKCFSLPLEPSGTAFMKKVWNALLEIPYGQVRSYKDIAKAVNSPKAYRAVGSANNKNPLPIFIPCHRVLSAKGDLVGYAGGLKMKKLLLDIEGYQS